MGKALLEILSDPEAVGMCGMYCGACNEYRKQKCPRCMANEEVGKFCPIRQCVLQHGFRTCADCGQFPNPRECSTYNGGVTKVMGLLFGKDRAKGIERIRRFGLEMYASEMADQERVALPKG